MSKRQQQQQPPPSRENRTHQYWGGRPLKRSTSDLFVDRPRMPNTIFSGKIERGTSLVSDNSCLFCFRKGPNALWNQRYPSRELIGDVGEGQASALRSLDVGYLTRYDLLRLTYSIQNRFLHMIEEATPLIHPFVVLLFPVRSDGQRLIFITNVNRPNPIPPGTPRLIVTHDQALSIRAPLFEKIKLVKKEGIFIRFIGKKQETSMMRIRRSAGRSPGCCLLVSSASVICRIDVSYRRFGLSNRKTISRE